MAPGKKHSNVAGVGLPQSTVRRLCSFLSQAVRQGASLQDGSLPPGFHRLLGSGAKYCPCFQA